VSAGGATGPGAERGDAAATAEPVALSAREAVAPGARPAAALVLLRDACGTASVTAPGFEVLLLVRGEHGAGDQRSGAAVFPGGVVDARDAEARAWCLGADDAALSRAFGVVHGALDFAVAAVREAFEEAGLLLACTPDGGAPSPQRLAQALAEWRMPVLRGEVGIAEVCRALDLRLDLRALAYSAHWLTPPGVPKRFDTRFFTAPAPAGQTAVPDGGETLAAHWLRPAQALDAAAGLKLLPPLRLTLQALAALPAGLTAAAAHAAVATRAADRGVALTMPRLARDARGTPKARVVMPDEPAWAEIGRIDPVGRGDAAAAIEPGVPVRLSAAVWRVTAPNPGPMTGPGTNSYLVGGAPVPGQPVQWTVIDPGPADAVHRQALLDAARVAGGADARIVRVLVTHTHRDHSPGAAALAEATDAEVGGRLADHAEGQDASFAPTRPLSGGERLALAPGVTLQVLHTPGHASNHLCYLLEEEALLFTGDHVMQGSTVVINPPDGDMGAYLGSLRALRDWPAQTLRWLAPGHGFLVAQPQAVIDALIAHRLRREHKVRQALQALAPCALPALVPAVYDDVPPALHALARRSLLAHLLKLRADGEALWAPDAATPPIAARGEGTAPAEVEEALAGSEERAMATGGVWCPAWRAAAAGAP
jgi:glyoxylase-like metal-dependent hydrolase (beta-lactamase superfamily II)/8-oxo-dGTP pyrophosphatase MutT (NUDIX family)